MSKAELEAYIADEFIPAMRKMLPVITPPPDWQPIETAPKDGTTILVFHNGSMWTVLWSDVQEWHDANDYGYTPTHWMPLPKPPTV